ncbi:zinc finger BED domain-containing protein 4-like isoform X2 [Acanthochromis polyacanthus]|uniref:zinc finger BED domain-containing protein 4-like n=1 Tax=Acanthochromis polyacanthus TaxID=80966 RepID=UPI002233F190|nr:zinc finger BED domain-containing protein 4-like [Acanthochromis polyacanthus]XP_051815564.1 zinc finger BED domain-containing protein 4-like isoform X2 [Acanthochromis polyacanthus]
MADKICSVYFYDPQVKCRLCSTELSYATRNTSSMLRHYKARHEREDNTPGMDTASRKQALNRCIINMIIKDCQPLSIVEDEGFREMLQTLEPSYAIPTRKALKEMVSERYAAETQNIKEKLHSTNAISLTADMWTSVNMEAYLAVTGHFFDTENKMCTTVLGVKYFPKSHTAENIAEVTQDLIDSWAITGKVARFVTDAGANMIASARLLKIGHSPCIAHTLNLIVKKSCDQVSDLTDIRHKTKNIVTYFRSSTLAKEKLSHVQQQMQKPILKLINEVPTRWNSTYQMLSRIASQKEPVWVSLASLKTPLPALTGEEHDIIAEVLIVLAPFNAATVELSEEKRVSGSKIIPMMKMLHHTMQKCAPSLETSVGKKLRHELDKRVTETLNNYESSSHLSLATLLDPRFKALGFLNGTKINDAVKKLKSECAAEMRISGPPSAPQEDQPGPSSHLPASSMSDNLWQQLDMEVARTRTSTSVVADAMIEVQRYLSSANIPRTEDPLEYWKSQKNTYPHLFKLSQKYLSTPASSAPCERIFSKAGEIASKRRNRLSPNMLQKLLFLNKNV